MPGLCLFGFFTLISVSIKITFRLLYWAGIFLLAFVFFIFLAVLYIPGVQIFLAQELGINFMFMYLTGFDWLVCFLISLICIAGFEIVKFVVRKMDIKF